MKQAENKPIFSPVMSYRAGIGLHSLQLFAVTLILLFSCSRQEQLTPEARTMAAWRAMQKVGFDANKASPIKGKLNEPATLLPGIKYFRAQAEAFSKINLENADLLLQQHLARRVTLYRRFADELEAQYKDVVQLMQSYQQDAQMRHVFVNLLADTKEEKLAGEFAELFTQAMANDDFQKDVARIGENHTSEMNEIFTEAQKHSDEEIAVADALSKKYNIVFQPNYYDGK